MSSRNVKRRLETLAAQCAAEAATTNVVDFNTQGIKLDKISESTSATGVTIDSVVCKDGALEATAIDRSTAGTFTIGASTATGVQITPALTIAHQTLKLSSTATLEASGSNAANAIANAPIINVVTLANGAANTGIALPVASVGQVRMIINTGGSTVLVYPQVGTTINALASGTSLSLATAKAVICIGTSTTSWYTIPTVPS